MHRRTIDFLILIFVIGFALLVVTAARSSPSCLTKHEARERYGDRWLYWHTPMRCWDDKRRNVRQWPLSKRDASGDAKKSAPVLSATHNSGEGDPAVTSDRIGADTIWPDIPTEIAFSYRWPDILPMPSPSKWLRELLEFGRGK